MPIPAVVAQSLPSHASPGLPPTRSVPASSIYHYDLTRQRDPASHHPGDGEPAGVPPSLLSPAFTPPATPGDGSRTPTRRRGVQRGIPVEHELDGESVASNSASSLSAATTPTTSSPLRKGAGVGVEGGSSSSGSGRRSGLLEQLPSVSCVVRARIPTTSGAQMFLHLYTNSIDDKEHLAIVFGEHIRSTSLDAPVPGETELDRMIRGAYVGTLHPGRTSSRRDDRAMETGGTAEGTEAQISASLSAPPLTLQEAQRPDEAATITTRRSEPRTFRCRRRPLLPLVRIHSECYTGETAWSARCDCGEQLDEAARLMSLPEDEEDEEEEYEDGEGEGEEEGKQDYEDHDSTSGATGGAGGVIVYLRQEGRGIGLGEKLKAYNLQDLGSDTVEANLLLRHPADARSYGLATAILVDLGLGRAGEGGAAGEGGRGGRRGGRGIRLLTNNPDKIRAVEGPNREVRVVERVPMVPLSWKTGGSKGIHSAEIERYLQTKVSKMGHMIS